MQNFAYEFGIEEEFFLACRKTGMLVTSMVGDLMQAAATSMGSERCALTRRIIDENRWRAKRDGVRALPIDERATVPAADVLRGLLAELDVYVDRHRCRDAGLARERILGARVVRSETESAVRGFRPDELATVRD